MKLTENEAKVINFIARNPAAWNSIRQIAAEIKISAMGAQKILKKLEKEQIVKLEKIGRGSYYKINFQSKLANQLTQLVLGQSELNPYAAIYAEDLRELKPYALSCILFGSILTKGEMAKDVDVHVVIERKNIKKVEEVASSISRRATKQVQLVIQTEKDFVDDIKKRHKVVLEIIKTGAVLWGEALILRCVEHGSY